MKKRSRLLDILRGSAIISLLDKLSIVITNALSGGLFGYLFSGGERINNRFRSGLFGSALNGRRRGGNTRDNSALETVPQDGFPSDGIPQNSGYIPLKRRFARIFEGSAIMRGISSVTTYLLGCSLRNYGIFFVSFGIYTVIVALVKHFALPGGAPGSDGILGLDGLFFGAVTAAAAAPLLFLKMSVASAVRSGKLAGAFIINALGIPAERFEGCAAKYGGRGNIAFVLGIFCGAATYYIPPMYIILLFFGFIFINILFSMPETGVLFMIFLLPFLVVLPHPSIVLAALVLFDLSAYLIKLFRGKRVFSLSFPDLIVLVFMLLFFMGGIVSLSPSESIKTTLIYCVFMLGYFLVVNLMRTKFWIRRAMLSLVVSSVIVSAYGILQNFTGAADSKWTDTSMFTQISGRVVSTFENPNMLAQYLIICFPFALACLLTVKTAGRRLAAFCACACIGACIVYTWSRGAWLGLLIGMVVFFIIYSRRTWSALAFVLVGAPFLPFVLPESIISRFGSIGNLSDSSTSYRVYIWRAVINMIGDFFGGGIGVGEGAFAQVYPLYTFSGIEAAPHTHNLYFQIIIELGIVGLIVFLAAIFLFIQSCSDNIADSGKGESRLMCAAGLCGILAALAQGATEYIWYNYRVFFMFWVVIGLASAYSRLGKRETAVCSAPYMNGPEAASLELRRGRYS